VVTAPADVVAGLEVQEEIEAGPLTFHVRVPEGATAPTVPVTVAVKAKVELSAPLPTTTPVATTVGVAFGTRTFGAGAAASDR